jgi:hypothetical protein
MPRTSLSLIAMSVVLLQLAFPAFAQATRTWVSGVGDDANPCSRTAPCKTFAGAISKTVSGGNINCIDSGGFGAVTITKSITIDCAPFIGGVLAAGTNAIIINGAGIIVALRHLDIEGVGSGLTGVNFINGAVLHIEHCRIFGFNAGSARGISFVSPAGVTGQLFVTDSSIRDNGSAGAGAGAVIQAVGTGSARAVFTRVSAANNVSGIGALGAGATGDLRVTIEDSTVAGSSNLGVFAISANGQSFTRIMVDRTAVVNNSNGISVSGTQAGVLLANSTVTSNVNGLVSATGGQIISYKTNNLNGNITSDGAPTAFLVPN